MPPPPPVTSATLPARRCAIPSYYFRASRFVAGHRRLAGAEEAAQVDGGFPGGLGRITFRRQHHRPAAVEIVFAQEAGDEIPIQPIGPVAHPGRPAPRIIKVDVIRFATAGPDAVLDGRLDVGQL